MTQKEFFNLYYKIQGNLFGGGLMNETRSAVFVSAKTYESKSGYRFALQGKMDREFKCIVADYKNDIANHSRKFSGPFKGILKSINATRGTLEVYNTEIDKDLEYKWDEIDLRKLNPTYQDLLEKM